MDTHRGRLAELVIARRAELGLSQRDVARRVGVSPGAIGQLEAGVSILGDDATDRLAVALELDEAGRLDLLAARLERAGELALAGRGQGGRRRDSWERVDALEVDLGDLRRRLDRIEGLLPVLGDDELEAEAGPDPTRG